MNTRKLVLVPGQGGGTTTVTNTTGVFWRTVLVKDTTVGENLTDNVVAFNRQIGQAGTIRRITGTPKEAMTADFVCRLRVKYASGEIHTIGTFTVPSSAPLAVAISFLEFDWPTLPDLSVFLFDITASDGSKAKNGVVALTVEWVSRGAGQATAEGLAWQGPWDAGSTYAKDDLTEDEGSSWISLQPGNTGHKPSESGDWWALVAGKGADGVGTPGADGTAATIAVGTVATGEPGTDASVTNSGTSSAAVFDFVIPRGADGAGSGSTYAEPITDGVDSLIFAAGDVVMAIGVPL